VIESEPGGIRPEPTKLTPVTEGVVTDNVTEVEGGTKEAPMREGVTVNIPAVSPANI
jgi:hypothetical protein